MMPYGLLRASHSRVYASLRSVLGACRWHAAPYTPFAYRRTTSRFYAHVVAGPKPLRPYMSKLIWAFGFVPWASYFTLILHRMLFDFTFSWYRKENLGIVFEDIKGVLGLWTFFRYFLFWED